jgi:hypothetical protein
MSLYLVQSLIVLSLSLHVQCAPLSSRSPQPPAPAVAPPPLNFVGGASTGPSTQFLTGCNFPAVGIAATPKPTFIKYKNAQAAGGALKASLSYSVTPATAGIVVADSITNSGASTYHSNDLINAFIAAHTLTLNHLVIPNIIPANLVGISSLTEPGLFMAGSAEFVSIIGTPSEYDTVPSSKPKNNLGEMAGRVATPRSIWADPAGDCLIVNYVNVTPIQAPVSAPVTATTPSTAGGSSGTTTNTGSAPPTTSKKSGFFSKIFSR